MLPRVYAPVLNTYFRDTFAKQMFSRQLSLKDIVAKESAKILCIKYFHKNGLFVSQIFPLAINFVKHAISVYFRKQFSAKKSKMIFWAVCEN